MTEKCPHCNAEIDCYSAWSNSDHQSDFRYVCGECDGIMEIEVSMSPDFSVGKPRCEKCNVIVDGTKPYCDTCREKLARPDV